MSVEMDLLMHIVLDRDPMNLIPHYFRCLPHRVDSLLLLIAQNGPLHNRYGRIDLMT